MRSTAGASGRPRLRDGPRLVPKSGESPAGGIPTHTPSCPAPGRPHLARPVILPRAPRVPVPSGTHGEPRTLTVRISLTVYQSPSLLTDRYGPHLCKAGVEGSSPFVSTKPSARSDPGQRVGPVFELITSGSHWLQRVPFLPAVPWCWHPWPPRRALPVWLRSTSGRPLRSPWRP